MNASDPLSERKTNLISCPGMANRPTEELDRPFSRQEVAELRQRLAKLAPSTVIDEYHRVYEKCRIDGDRLPMAKSVQELAVMWKVLWQGRFRSISTGSRCIFAFAIAFSPSFQRS